MTYRLLVTHPPFTRSSCGPNVRDVVLAVLHRQRTMADGVRDFQYGSLKFCGEWVWRYPRRCHVAGGLFGDEKTNRPERCNPGDYPEISDLSS